MNSNNYDSSKEQKNITNEKSQKSFKKEKITKKTVKSPKNSLEAIKKLDVDAVFINLKIFSRIKTDFAR